MFTIQLGRMGYIVKNCICLFVIEFGGLVLTRMFRERESRSR
jgi:hypothetical protein